MRVRYVGSALAAVLLTIFSTSFAQGQQGTLAGTVTSQGMPVAAAQISILGGQPGVGTLTNDQGRYSIALPAGTYRVQVDHVAFAATMEDDVTVTAGQTTTLNIVLEPAVIQLDPITSTVDRSQVRGGEKSTEAPATTATVSGPVIRERPTVNPSEHVEDVAGVNVAKTGLQNSTVVVRGFNNIFSGSLHMLTDYRLAGVPSLRVNLMHFMPITDEDLDRVEVVLGPASALYGPNTANGVVHFISKSPLDEQSTTVSLGTGSKGKDWPSAVRGTFRSAFTVTEDLGFKISGQYMEAEEWIYYDRAELEAQALVESSPANRAACIADRQARGLPGGAAQQACDRIGDRDFDLERWSLEARADWRFADDGAFIATYGRNSSSGIELTGLGAGQTDGWIYDFFQARMSKGRLFAQGYYNGSSSGDSFLLRDGVGLVDESSLVVGQLQHGFTLAEGRQDFTYGIDYFGTNPQSARRIYGSYENQDEMDEWGVYLQSETAITPQLDLIVAGRIDDHSILADQVFSPRAALVFKPDSTSGIRFSYNQAFSTPTALNFFLDISGGFAPAPLGSLGFTTRAFGSGPDGWSLRGPDGTFEWMRSPFTPAAFGGPSQLLPAEMPTLWSYYIGVIEAGGGLDPATAAFLRSMPPTEEQVTRLALDPNDESFEPLATLSIPRLPSTTESNTETFELGYTGVIDNRVRIAADVYRTTKNDFVSPLRAETPLIFLNPAEVEAYLTPIVGPGAAAALARPAGVDEDGNPNPLPLGVVSSEDVGAQAADIILSYRNVGDITLYGGDLSLQAFLTEEWVLSGAYSFVSDDVFEITDGDPIALNAPQHRGALGLAYRSVETGLNWSSRLRFNSEFPAFSADFEGTVESAAVVDMTAGYRIPSTSATVQLSVSNLFGSEYRSFVGAPEIGRFTMLAVRYELF